MQLENIDLAKLSVSPANMRNAKKPPDISDILPSVRVRGVLVPLLVRPNGSADTFEIVAGRRRYYAATTVAEEGGSDGPLPCAILEEGDDAAALEASLIENRVPQGVPVRVGSGAPFSGNLNICDLVATISPAHKKMLPNATNPVGFVGH